jgi:hypothetical protein
MRVKPEGSLNFFEPSWFAIGLPFDPQKLRAIGGQNHIEFKPVAGDLG